MASVIKHTNGVRPCAWFRRWTNDGPTPHPCMWQLRHRLLKMFFSKTFDDVSSYIVCNVLRTTGINFLNNNTTAAPSNRLREKPAIDCAAVDVGHYINEAGPYCQAHNVATLLKGCHHVLGSMDGRAVVRTAWRCRQNHLLNFSGEASFATSSKWHFSNYLLC